MKHRHLNHEGFTPAAIDDIIGRGGREDWVELRQAVATDPLVLGRILQVCTAHVSDPYAQRYHLWKSYAQRRLA